MNFFSKRIFFSAKNFWGKKTYHVLESPKLHCFNFFFNYDELFRDPSKKKVCAKNESFVQNFLKHILVLEFSNPMKFSNRRTYGHRPAYLYVRSQVTLLCKRCWAEFAGIRFLLSVCRHMDLQRTFLVECFLTLTAFKRSFSCRCLKCFH